MDEARDHPRRSAADAQRVVAGARCRDREGGHGGHESMGAFPRRPLAVLARRESCARARVVHGTRARRHRMGRGRRTRALDDAGPRPAHLHQRADAVPGHAARCPDANPTGLYRTTFSIPRAWARAADRAARRRGRQRGARLGEREPGRDQQGLPARGRVRRDRARDGRVEHARADGRALVGRELRGGSGSVVARGHRPQRHADRDRPHLDRGRSRAGRAGIPQRASAR